MVQVCAEDRSAQEMGLHWRGVCMEMGRGRGGLQCWASESVRAPPRYKGQDLGKPLEMLKL